VGLIKVPLMEDESLTSFTSRFAHANARNAAELCLDFGLSWRSVSSGREEAITQIAELSGIDRARLEVAAVKLYSKKSLWVAGEETPLLFYTRGVMKFCPACFAADEERHDIKPGSRKYIRKTWYFRFVRTCPIHNQSLVSAGTHGHSRYIHDLCWSLDYLRRDIAIASRESVRQEFTAFEEYARLRLSGDKPGNDFLDPLPLFVAGDVCELAGLVAIHGKQVRINGKTERQRWEACAKGFELFTAGLPGFHRFLDRLASDGVKIRRAQVGGNELFGKFHENLANWKADTAYEPVREAARTYAFATFALTDTTNLFGKGGKAGFVSFNSMATRYGLSEGVMRKYYKTTGADIVMPGNGFTAIPVADVENLVATMKDLIRRSEAVKILGVTKTGFNLLLDSGLIVSAINRDGAAQFAARYSKTAVSDFRDTLLARATTQDLTGLMPLRAIPKKLLTTTVSIIRILLGGSLKRVGIDPAEHGIMSLMLDPDEVAGLLPAPAKPEDGFLVPADMVIALGASAASIGFLIRECHIETVPRAHAKTGYPQRVATEQTVRMFREKHVTLSECCHRLGRRPPTVRSILTAAGVEPLFPKDILREQFYPRMDAMTALGLTDPEEAEMTS